MTSAIGDCYSCGYPISATQIGQTISCPWCNSINEAITIEPPSISGILLGFIGSFIAGVVIYQMSKGRITS